MISLGAAIRVVMTLIVAGLIFWLLWWLLDYCQLQAPFDRIAHVVLAILAVCVIIGILYSILTGKQIFKE